MQRTHLIVGACVAVLGGAVSGAAINTTPLTRGIDAWDHLPRHEFTAAQLEAEARSTALPDHYPLITPSGRIEVAELRDHGLYRNRRFGMGSGWYEPSEEPSYAVVSADYRYVPDDFSDDAARATGSRPAAAAPDEPVALAANTEPLDPLEAEAPVALKVRPRTIDVAAVLASR